MDVFDAIRSRRSVREFKDKEINREDIKNILGAGQWAPSGKNTQPWRFVVVLDERTQEKLEKIVPQGMINEAPVTIAILKDKDAGYDELKDAQGIGACAQNIMLAAHALGIGSCWIGLTGHTEAEKILRADDNEELMMLIVFGYPTETERSSTRLGLDELTRYI